jgi:hypothetical protein
LQFWSLIIKKVSSKLKISFLLFAMTSVIINCVMQQLKDIKQKCYFFLGNEEFE